MPGRFRLRGAKERLNARKNISRGKGERATFEGLEKAGFVHVYEKAQQSIQQNCALLHRTGYFSVSHREKFSVL